MLISVFLYKFNPIKNYLIFDIKLDISMIPRQILMKK